MVSLKSHENVRPAFRNFFVHSAESDTSCPSVWLFVRRIDSLSSCPAPLEPSDSLSSVVSPFLCAPLNVIFKLDVESNCDSKIAPPRWRNIRRSKDWPDSVLMVPVGRLFWLIVLLEPFTPSSPIL